MTLPEVMVTMAISGILLTIVAQLYVYGLRSFTSLGNYADMDGKSRMALDLMSREIREASAVVSIETNATSKILTLTNAMDGTLLRYTWDGPTATLVSEQTGTPSRTNLIGCDIWNVTMFQRPPGRMAPSSRPPTLTFAS